MADQDLHHTCPFLASYTDHMATFSLSDSSTWTGISEDVLIELVRAKKRSVDDEMQIRDLKARIAELEVELHEANEANNASAGLLKPPAISRPEPPKLIKQPQNGPDSRGEYAWTIRELQKGLNRRTSEIFECMGFQWSLLVFLDGRTLSAYLVAADDRPRSVEFQLVLVNKVYTKNIWRSISHSFDRKDSDYGWTEFADRGVVMNPTSGFQRDGALVLKVKMRPPRPGKFRPMEQN